MDKKFMLACVIALPLLIFGCQSSLTRILRVAAQCQPLPAPWFMEKRESDLTQRMLNELLASPMTAT